MKLSIIVPVYQVENYIRPCIESIFKQGLAETDFEVIIVNDGTKDRSMEMIEDIIATHKNITVINQENQSLSVARNNGLAKAKGEYVLMPDSDDLLIDNSLPILLAKALETKADLIVADFLQMTDQQINTMTPIQQPPLDIHIRTGEDLFLIDLNPNECYVWRTLYRLEFLTENNILFIPGISCQDVPFTHECYLKAQNSLKVNTLLNIYRQRASSATSFFHKRKCTDLCTAMVATWKLRNLEGLTEKAKLKLFDNVFVTFKLLFYVMNRCSLSKPDRIEIFDTLQRMAPDLAFSHGFIQKVSTQIYYLSPSIIYWLYKKMKIITSVLLFSRRLISS